MECEITKCTTIKLLLELKDKYFEELLATKRALWIARAERAKTEAHWLVFKADVFAKWQWVERKCRAKAEQYR